MSILGTFVCAACGYESPPVLLGSHGELYDRLLGRCDPCRELRTFDPDQPWCTFCGNRLLHVVPGELDEVACPRCPGDATLAIP